MPAGSRTDILVLSNTQAKALAGSLLAIGEEVFWLKDYDPAYPGQPPWRSGAEGKAFPLLGRDGTVAAYLKFFTRPTQERLTRTAWLIGQQMHTWLPGLVAAPLLWIDTRLSPRSAEIDFDFAGYLAHAVPGETWLETKNHIVEAETSLPEEFRWRCAEDLLLATATLERAGIVHGDLSPNNVVIDREALPGEPALYLIDFDAFVAPAAGRSQAIDVAGGGTYGTEGYCPPDLASRAAAGDGAAAPYSDRYGRDMLILELLLMDHALPPDDPPTKWKHDEFARRRAAWRASGELARRQMLTHLDVPELFSLSEQQRPTSIQLAAELGLELPEPPVVYADPATARSPAAIFGMRSTSAHSQKRRGRQPARARPPSPGRPVSPSSAPPLGQWLISAQVVPRRLRRTPPRGPLPRDTLGNVVMTVAFIALLLLALFVPSCMSAAGIGRSFKTKAPRRNDLTELPQNGPVGNALRGVPGAAKNGVFLAGAERHGGRSLQENSSTYFDAIPQEPRQCAELAERYSLRRARQRWTTPKPIIASNIAHVPGSGADRPEPDRKKEPIS
jgi:hypothetical protein